MHRTKGSLYTREPFLFIYAWSIFLTCTVFVDKNAKNGIPIRSTDERFDGAWMRAFDMDTMEYYGCDKDFAWGPYCILTGWVTGAVPLVFLDLLGLKTMY